MCKSIEIKRKKKNHKYTNIYIHYHHKYTNIQFHMPTSIHDYVRCIYIHHPYLFKDQITKIINLKLRKFVVVPKNF